MKILFDFSFLKDKPYTGVAKYAFNILNAWRESDVENTYVLVTPGGYEILKKKMPEYHYVIIGKSKCLLDIPKLSLFYLFSSWMLHVWFNRYDCVYLPWANFINFFFVNKIKIATIHDIQNYKRSSGLIRWMRRGWLFFVMHSSRKVICISNYVYSDLQKYHIVNKSKLKVIYNGIKFTDFQKRNERLVSDKYILCVNTFLPQKNHTTLIKAFAVIKDRIPHKLLFVGTVNPYWEKVLYPLILSLKLEDRVIQMQNLSEDDLHNVYEYADLFVTTSRNEGFGFTPIEAAICKVPVICSKEEALFETTKELLIYYEPVFDDEKLSVVMEETLLQEYSYEHLKSISDELRKAYDIQARAQEVREYIINICNKILTV